MPRVPALADTSVLVDYLRGVEPARDLIRPVLQRGDVVAASVLTRVELSIGTRQAERRKTDALVAAIQWIGIDAAIADEADRLARRYGRSHSGIDAVDYCIAATARVRELTLWTLNVRHFPMFAKLQAPW
jgi:predicted nucleic acid-binding protein